MRSHWSAVFLTLAAAACSNEPLPSAPGTLAQSAANTGPRYDVVTLSSLGGSASRGMAINDDGVVAGWSLQADGTRHAVLWSGQTIIPLGSLGGPNTTVPWPGLNDRGMVVGIGQTGAPDTLAEAWSCEDGGFIPVTSPRQVCRGFFWFQGVMQPMPTLGGTHSFATSVNNRGQVVGWAEMAQHDPTCTAALGTGPQQLGFLAVLWEPLRGRLRRLRPFPGHSATAATAINERGQVVGISGDCDQAVGRFSARKAALWQGDRLIEIPNLGGTSWHTPMDINAKGDVTGFSNPPLPGDVNGDFLGHAFYWRYGADRAVDLGTLPGDALSEGFGINALGQVVGVSFGGTSGSRAFIYENGVMTNLNDLVDVAPNVLQSAQHINDAGQITGRMRDAATGKVLAFIATPRREDRR